MDWMQVKDLGLSLRNQLSLQDACKQSFELAGPSDSDNPRVGQYEKMSVRDKDSGGAFRPMKRFQAVSTSKLPATPSFICSVDNADYSRQACLPAPCILIARPFAKSFARRRESTGRATTQMFFYASKARLWPHHLPIDQRHRHNCRGKR